MLAMFHAVLAGQWKRKRTRKQQNWNSMHRFGPNRRTAYGATEPAAITFAP